MDISVGIYGMDFNLENLEMQKFLFEIVKNSRNSNI